MIDVTEQMKQEYPDIAKYLDKKKEARVQLERRRRIFRESYDTAPASISDDLTRLADARVRDSFLEQITDVLFEEAKNVLKSGLSKDDIEAANLYRGVFGTTVDELSEIVKENQKELSFDLFEGRYIRSFMNRIGTDLLNAPNYLITDAHVDRVLEFTGLKKGDSYVPYIRREMVRKEEAREVLDIYGEQGIVTPQMIDTKDYYNSAGANYFNSSIIIPSTEQVAQITRGR